MTGEAAGHRRRFYLGFLVVALLLAGVVSYLAYPHPDGLDTVARQGCEATEVNGAEQLTGTCIAQHATEPATAGSPLADYALQGNSAFTGAAGIVGVLVTLAVAGALFWLLRRRGAPSDLPERGGRPEV
jgi:cobalt/nickel transport protein